MIKPLARASQSRSLFGVLWLNASITCSSALISYIDVHHRDMFLNCCKCVCLYLFLIYHLSFKSFSIFAGGIFIFPLFSPTLALHLKFTQSQLTTIVLLWGLFTKPTSILLILFSGMMGQYPFSAFIGKIIDEYGPWACSLIASFLFSSSFAVFAAEVAKTPDDITESSESSFRILAGSFFLMGLASATSYVSS